MPFSARLKGSFVAGLILITPLVVTLLILRVLLNWSLQFVNPVVRETRLVEYTANIEAAAQIIAFLLIVATITLLGYIAQGSVGKRMFGSIGRVTNVIPLVDLVYGSVRQVANALVDRDTAFQRVVLVEYPRNGIYSLALLTGESPTAVQEFAGQDMYNVFLPNTPNPTAGRLVLLPEDQIHEIDMSVRNGMRLIVTTGMGEKGGYSSHPGLEPEG